MLIDNKNIKLVLNGTLLTVAIPIILCILIFGGLWLFKISFEIRDVVLLLTCMTAILTFALHNVNSKKNLQHLSIQQKNFKRKNSYNIITKISSPEMAQTLRNYKDIKKDIPNLVNHTDVEKLKDHLKQFPEKEDRLHMLLNLFESVAQQIKHNHVDEDMIKDAFHSMFYDIFKTLNSYIKFCQSEDMYKKCWDDFENICNKWGKPS